MNCTYCGMPHGHTDECKSENPYESPVFNDEGFLLVDLRSTKLEHTRRELQRWLDSQEKKRREKVK